MKKEELEKYIGELSPEMQEKARECKTMDELNALLAENDVELSEDALGAVAGGCSVSDKHPVGTPLWWKCPQCGEILRYWDSTQEFPYRLHCYNENCIARQENWLFGAYRFGSHTGFNPSYYNILRVK